MTALSKCPVEARAGFLDRPMAVALVASSVLATILLALAYGDALKIF
jgi:hypothetical protein